MIFFMYIIIGNLGQEWILASFFDDDLDSTESYCHHQ